LKKCLSSMDICISFYSITFWAKVDFCISDAVF